MDFIFLCSGKKTKKDPKCGTSGCGAVEAAVSGVGLPSRKHATSAMRRDDDNNQANKEPNKETDAQETTEREELTKFSVKPPSHHRASLCCSGAQRRSKRKFCGSHYATPTLLAALRWPIFV